MSVRQLKAELAAPAPSCGVCDDALSALDLPRPGTSTYRIAEIGQSYWFCFAEALMNVARQVRRMLALPQEKHGQRGRSLCDIFSAVENSLLQPHGLSEALGQRKFRKEENRQYILLGRAARQVELQSCEAKSVNLPAKKRLVDGVTAVCHYGEGTTGIVNVNEREP